MRSVCALALLVGLGGLVGCGQPSQTVLVEMSAHGQPPDGVATARFTVEEIRVFDDVPGIGGQWRTLVSDEEGARTFDLCTLGSGTLAAERDVPQGTLSTLQISLDLDEGLSGALPLDPDARSVLELPLPQLQGNSVHLDVDWDLAATVARDGQGRLVLRPAADLKVLP
ncbi:MAG: DUF4382 domain-containing protein [Deltaproteobacteria bacterium]|nr:DUF4382 domain-containing protein [Deltaproteobacteria bacterium]